MDTDISYEEEDALLSEERGEDVGLDDVSISNSHRQDRKRNTANELKKSSEHKTKEFERLKAAKDLSGEKSKRKSAFKTTLSHARSISKTCQIHSWQMSKLACYPVV